jgi:alpha-glucosidase/alpha-D-xyloside xylohydrolase
MKTRLIVPALLAASAFSQQTPQGPAPLRVAGRDVEATVTVVDARTLRVSVSPLDTAGVPLALPDGPALVSRTWPGPALRLRSVTGEQKIALGRFRVLVTPEPLRFRIQREDGREVQDLRVDAQTGAFAFSLGTGPILGLGQGGEQFDRRRNRHAMAASHSGDRIVNGGRLPIPWLVGSPGWGLYVNRPTGDVDLSGEEGRAFPAPEDQRALLDVFVVGADRPQDLMQEYAELTGFPTMPPLWTLGYQQSHRTLTDREAVFNIARSFREKKLPCDALIYLGTGFAPSGWNEVNGSFAFNKKVFPNPQQDVRQLQEQNYKVVLHVVREPQRLYGSVKDPEPAVRDDNEAAMYWSRHKPALDMGADGWWPDEGEGPNAASRLARIRMYWEGSQLARPNIRPYALHRSGYAGMQRYGWLWSGDVFSNWDTFRRQVAVGINVSMSGVPYWGTDIGGFFPTTEYSGELYVRWFQFGAFCPLFRSHGVQSYLHLPWGWNTGDMGPTEWRGTPPGSGLPDPSELHNAKVEPICRKYLELRYRLLPYLYALVRETHDTGIPVMRALWLHYSDDPQAASRGDEYLWGRDMLVAPVIEKGATTRKVYLPRGQWFDFWTGAIAEGGHEVTRNVDLETLPLYVRAGAILPMGPVKQYTAEKSDAPLTLTIYPGADGDFTLYSDDGATFDYEKGDFSKIRCVWKDSARQLTLSLEKGSKMVSAAPRKIEVRIASGGAETPPGKTIVFSGRAASVRF